MKALIDLDILLYQLGAATDEEGHPLPWPFVKTAVDATIRNIVEQSGADSYVGYMSGSRNFRVTTATIKPYKGNRNAPKPYWHGKIKEYFYTTKNHEVIVCDGYEADDGMSMAQYAANKESEYIQDVCSLESDWVIGTQYNTIICSIDKDLDMVPGWHYRWPKKSQRADSDKFKPYYITQTEGLRWFYKQLLMGDSTDNIPGLYNVGPKSTLVTKLDKMETEQEFFNHVQHQYELRFGSYWKLFMHENATLLWMLKDHDDVVVDKLVELEKKRCQNKQDSLVY